MDAEINQVDIKFTFKQVCFGIGLVIAIGVSILGYYIYKIYYPSTDDAYASAPLINLTAKVNGSVKKVYVNNNQFVKSGDLLLELDPQDYTPLLEQANLDILMATKTAVTANQQRDNAKSNVNKAESNYTYAQQMAVRYTNLFNNKAGSQQTMQKFVNDRNIAKEVLDQARVVFKQATIQSELAKSKIGAC